jgi:hypothetical protein
MRVPCEPARPPGRWSATAEVQEHGRLTEQRSKAVVETVRELCQVKDVAGIFESDPPTGGTSSCASETPMHHSLGAGCEMGAGYAAVVASIHGLAARMFQVGSILASARGPVT